MSGRNPDNWRGGRKSQRAVDREVAATPEWKRSKRKAAGPGGRRRKSKFVLPVVLLLGMVALGIWIYQLDPEVHTHFVVLDLLKDSQHFDATPPPEFPDVPLARFPIGRTTMAHSDSLDFWTPDDEKNLTESHAILIYLQTQIVAGKDGEFVCLAKNSSPDLDKSSGGEKLSELKSNLKDLIKASKANVLLIVDQPSTLLDWRLGGMPADVADEILSWPNDEELSGLVVMVSTSGDQQSVPAMAGSGGQTAFGHIVQQGLSKAADLRPQDNGDGQLTVAEFCSFVISETDQWVRQNRRRSGQSVSCSPAPEELVDSGTDFVLMKELVDAPPAPAFRNPAEVVSRLDQLWRTRSGMDRLLAWRWRPLQWQAATEYLLRAQSALLDGDNSRAERLAERAEQQLSNLGKATVQYVANQNQLNPDLGLPRLWFNGLPFEAHLNDVWENGEPVEYGDMEHPADVLVANVQHYPFDRLGLPPPGEQQLAALRENRNTAEKTAARAMGMTGTVRQTVLAAEQQLLSTEDAVFIRTPPESNSEREVTETAQLWSELDDFIASHQQTEVVFQRALASVESLARWAAEYPLDVAPDFFADWNTLLKKNQPSNQPDSQQSRTLLDEATQLAGDLPGAKGIAVKLRSQIYGLLVATRMLQTLRHTEESHEVLTAAEMADLTKKMNDWREVTDESLAEVQKTLSTLVGRITETTKEPGHQINAYRQLRATANITSISPEERARVVGALLTLDKDMSSPQGKPADEVPEAVQASQLSQLLWRMQYLNLFLDAAGKDDPAFGPIDSTLQKILSANGDMNHNDVADLGAAIRTFWQRRREDAKDAVRDVGPNARHQLEHADVYARGLSAYDATELQGSPTNRLHHLWQVDYCLLQANRLLKSQWVRPDDGIPLVDNGWYAQNAKKWLDHAETLGRAVSATSTNVPAFINNDLQQLQESLRESAAWSITASPGISVADIGEQNTPDVNFQLALKKSVHTPDHGTAAVRFITAGDSSAVQAISFPNNAQALSVSSDLQQLESRVARTGSPIEGDCDSVTYTTSVFFRGRSWPSSEAMQVRPCAGKEFVVVKAARDMTASVLLQGAENRPVVLILDMSDSMKDPLDSGRTRLDGAIQTLKKFVEDPRFDRNTSVILKAFGHRKRFIKEKDTHLTNAEYNRVFALYDKSVDENLLAQNDVNTELRSTRLTADGISRVKEILTLLGKVGPWGTTPLVKAILQAVTEDLDEKPGIVIVVTDGEATDPLLAPKLAAAIEDNPGTKVAIVAFGFDNNPAGFAALRQFFNAKCKITDIFKADNTDELLSQIFKALDPQDYKVTGQLGQASVSQAIRQAIKGLKPAADYSISFANIQLGRDIALGPGDSVKLHVNWSERAFSFDRSGGADMKQTVSRPPAADEFDAPTILRSVKGKPAEYIRYADQNKPRDVRRVVLSLMLDHDNRARPVRQPAEIEFTIRSPDSSQPPPPRVSQTFTSEWGAPGFKLQIEDWPASQIVHVDAFWKMARSAPEMVIDYEPIGTADRKIVGGLDSLPKAQISTTLLPNGTLQVRLDRLPGTPDAADNTVADIRVEIGVPDRRELNSAFMPEEVTTTIRRTEKGSVIYEFQGDYTEERLKGKQIALTSRAARFRGALVLRDKLVMDKYTNSEASSAP